MSQFGNSSFQFRQTTLMHPGLPEGITHPVPLNLCTVVLPSSAFCTAWHYSFNVSSILTVLPSSAFSFPTISRLPVHSCITFATCSRFCISKGWTCAVTDCFLLVAPCYCSAIQRRMARLIRMRVKTCSVRLGAAHLTLTHTHTHTHPCNSTVDSVLYILMAGTAEHAVSLAHW